jgi:hypothetical protein
MTAPTTTTTSSKQLEGQTIGAEPTANRDAVNVVSIEVPKQVPEPVSEQDALEQEMPEQSLLSTIGEGQVLETNQGVPEQITATTSSAQDDLPDAAARGKMAMGPSTVRPN